MSHTVTFSTNRISDTCKEKSSWRLEDGESESGNRTSYAVGICEVLEAGGGLRLRVTGCVDCRRR